MKTQTFGQWLKAQRRSHAYTQKQVEEAIGVDHSQYSKWENDHNLATPETRAKFHEFYGTSDDDLVQLGILESYVSLDGVTHYIPAEHITNGDRAAEAAHRRLEGRAATSAPSPAYGSDNPRAVLMAMLERASDDDIRKAIQIIGILLGGIESNQTGDRGQLGTGTLG